METDDDEEEEEIEVSLDEILAPETGASFATKYWEAGEVFTTHLSDEVLDRLLRRGFYDGDVERVVTSCRAESTNRPYTPDDEADDGGGSVEAFSGPAARTLNLPFCFSPGAVALREALVGDPALGGHCFDVECGVYLSRPGGGAADWHLDNNHNITIQVGGGRLRGGASVEGPAVLELRLAPWAADAFRLAVTQLPRGPFPACCDLSLPFS